MTRRYAQHDPEAPDEVDRKQGTWQTSVSWVGESGPKEGRDYVHLYAPRPTREQAFGDVGVARDGSWPARAVTITMTSPAGFLAFVERRRPGVAPDVWEAPAEERSGWPAMSPGHAAPPPEPEQTFVPF